LARTEAVLDLVVVARARIGVLDQQTDRGTGGASLEDAGEDAHHIGFFALAHELRGAGAAAVDVALEIGLGEFEPRRTTIHHAADRRPMALAEGRHLEKSTDGVTGHGS
jgi:hypothetical protein